jgi:hypothetical protein
MDRDEVCTACNYRYGEHYGLSCPLRSGAGASTWSVFTSASPTQKRARMEYKTDGYTRTPLAEEIKIGAALRRPNRQPIPYQDGLSAFSDSIVLGIWTDEGHRHGGRRSYQDGAEALKEAPKDSIIRVEIARPYLYASTIGICFNWLQGVEHYAATLQQVLENYQVILLASGKVQNYTSHHGSSQA